MQRPDFETLPRDLLSAGTEKIVAQEAAHQVEPGPAQHLGDGRRGRRSAIGLEFTLCQAFPQRAELPQQFAGAFAHRPGVRNGAAEQRLCLGQAFAPGVIRLRQQRTHQGFHLPAPLLDVLPVTVGFLKRPLLQIEQAPDMPTQFVGLQLGVLQRVRVLEQSGAARVTRHAFRLARHIADPHGQRVVDQQQKTAAILREALDLESRAEQQEHGQGNRHKPQDQQRQPMAPAQDPDLPAIQPGHDQAGRRNAEQQPVRRNGSQAVQRQMIVRILDHAPTFHVSQDSANSNASSSPISQTYASRPPVLSAR